MHDAALPFRPRVSSPVDRALASIEAQTLGVRRRVNRFVLERAGVTFRPEYGQSSQRLAKRS